MSWGNTIETFIGWKNTGLIFIHKKLKKAIIHFLGGGQNLERPNVERPIFRLFEYSNIKIMKVELFDFFHFQIYFSFLRLFEFFEYSKYMIICQIENFGNFDRFTNCEILKIFSISKLNSFRNLIILWICQSREFPLEYEIKVKKLKHRNWFISKGKYENWHNCE